MDYSTRVDSALHEFSGEVISNPVLSPEHIMSLLEKYRSAFSLEAVFVNQVGVSGDSCYTYTVGDVIPCGTVGVFLREKAEIEADGYCTGKFDSVLSGLGGSVLSLGVSSGGVHDGSVGFVHAQPAKQWTTEERIALKKLSIVLERVIQSRQPVEPTAESNIAVRSKFRDRVVPFRARSMNDVMPVGIIIYKADESEKILYANDVLVQLFGCSSQSDFLEYTGGSFKGVVYSEDYLTVERSICEQVSASESRMDYVEYRIQRRDGSLRYVEDYGRLVHEDGVGDVFYVFVMDVTEKVTNSRLMEKYRESEMQLSAVTDCIFRSYDVVYLLDFELDYYKTLKVEQGVFRDEVPDEGCYSKYSYEYNRTYIDPYYSKIRSDVGSIENLKKVLRNEETVSCDFLMKSGGWRRTVYQCFEKENGIPTKALMFSQRIDAQRVKRMEDTRHAEMQYNIISGLNSEYSSISLIDIATKRLHLYQNRNLPVAVEELLDNTDYDDARHSYCELYVYEQDKELFNVETSLDVVLEKLMHTKLYMVRFRSIHRGYVSYTEFSFCAPIGDMQNIVFATKNITSYIEQELKRQELLRDALARAENTNQVKNTLLTNLSHDIRTPLNIVLGFSEAASLYADNSVKVREYMQMISESGKRLLDMLNKMLDIADIEGGKITLFEEPADINLIVDELHEKILAMAEKKNISVSLDTKTAVTGRVICDKLRLSQMLWNILENSVNYTNNGGRVEFIVRRHIGAPEGYGAFEFIVRDNGIGMKDQFLKRIFEPFSRERDTTRYQISGAGLGLAITKNIADILGGIIHVSSSEGVGTEFSILVNLRLQEVELMSAAENAALCTENAAD